MIQSMYQFCKGDKETEPGPFLTTQENRLVNFCVYIIQNDIWVCSIDCCVLSFDFLFYFLLRTFPGKNTG